MSAIGAVMKKVLLFYPSFMGENTDPPLYTDIPLSVVTLAGNLHGKYEIEILDERIKPQASNLEEKLKDTLAVGISTTTSYQIINGLQFAKKVRDFDSNIKIIWGGWHPSLMPYETIQHELVDIIILGQGEIIFEKLINCLYSSGDLNSVPNIIYKSRDMQVVKTARMEFPDLQMPGSMLDGYRYINMKDYIHKGWGNDKVLGYEASRGCTFACQFCSINAVFQRKWYGLPAQNIFNDIRYLKQKYDVNAIHFFDNNFFVEKRRVFALAQLMKEDKIEVRWDGTVVVKQFLNFTEKEIDVLKQSGFYRIIAGIESGDEEVLGNINKRHKNEEVLEVIRRCKAYGILPSLSFMVGFPWNPEKDTLNTIKLIEQIKNIHHDTEVLLFIFSPYLGTPLYEIAKDYDMVFPDNLKGWSEFTYDKTNTPWISEKLKRRINRYLSFFGTKEMTESQQLFFEKFE
jgi:radical SAM superfamily enzyme YgiQ (UPF0313 family)